jgi:hypothetical protein
MAGAGSGGCRRDDRPDLRRRGGAPRGRARLRHWRAERLRKGVPVLPRFLLAHSDEVGRGGTGGAPGCGDPHQRPRGAPLPLGATCWSERKARLEPVAWRSRQTTAGTGGAWLFDIVNRQMCRSVSEPVVPLNDCGCSGSLRSPSHPRRRACRRQAASRSYESGVAYPHCA